MQLAAAVAQLSGGGPGILDTARNLIGVDVLSFTPAEGDQEHGRVRAGKYLTDELYVGVEQGAEANSTTPRSSWRSTTTSPLRPMLVPISPAGPVFVFSGILSRRRRNRFTLPDGLRTRYKRTKEGDRKHEPMAAKWFYSAIGGAALSSSRW